MSSVSIARENPNPTPNRNPGLFLPRFIHDSFYSTIFSFLLLSFPFSLPLPTTPSPPASSHPPMPPFLARRTAASFPHAPPHNLHSPPPSVLAVAVTEGGVFGWPCARRRGQGRGERGGPSCAPRPIRRSRTVPEPVMEEYSEILPVGVIGEYELLPMPKVEELGYGDISQEEISPFRGGETEALKRMRESLQDKEWVAKFEKPKGDPSAFLKPATTVLSSYLKFGCLSSRYFYHCIQDVCRTARKHTKPAVSLTGQLLWRDFFYTVSFGTPNFDCMKGNKICKQIPWRENEELFVAWRDGRTGYPWIDAIMIQLKKWGWMHHLARHSVACFLTRGDLEKGRDIFERLLIDSDWAINNDNWLWLSCSSFFYQYHRIYSPISFGKKYDPNRNYIRHFIPVLKGTHQQHFSTRKQLLCDFKTHPKR